MDKFVQLSDILKKQCKVQKDILEIEKQKNDILLKGDAKRLDGLMNSEQALLMESSNYEKERETFQKNNDMGEMTLKNIVERYAPNDEYSLKTIMNELTETISKLKHANALNEKLLNTHLQLIHQFREQLGIGEAETTYKKR